MKNMKIYLCTKSIRKDGLTGHANSFHVTFLDVLVPIPWSFALNKTQVLMKTGHSKCQIQTIPLPYKRHIPLHNGSKAYAVQNIAHL